MCLSFLDIPGPQSVRTAGMAGRICKYNPSRSLRFGLFLFVIFSVVQPTAAFESTEPNINEMVAQLDFQTADINDVITVFGKPTEYIWENLYYTRENLPIRYVARYPYGLSVFMVRGGINELRFDSLADDYLLLGRIRIGSGLEEVLEVLGKPKEVVQDRPCGWSNGVLYKDIDRVRGYCYYLRSDRNVRFFFRDYRVSAIYLTGPQAQPGDDSLVTSPTEPASVEQEPAEEPATTEPNLVDRVGQLDLDSARLEAFIRIFGPPEDYFWQQRTYTADTLPEKFLARYANGFSALVESDKITELRFESSNCEFVWADAVKVGSSLEVVLEVAPEPFQVVVGETFEKVDGVLYKDIDGRKGHCYYKPADEPVKFHFLKNRLVALHLLAGGDLSQTEGAGSIEASGPPPGLNISEKIEQLNLQNATMNDIRRIFGEPSSYVWGGQLYTKDNLPDKYIARYPDKISVFVRDGRVWEVRLKSADAGYLWRDQIEIGSPIEQVMTALGEPKEVVEGEASDWADAIFYKNIDGQEGRCYYARAEFGIRLFFKDYRVSAVYLTNKDYALKPF